MCVIVHTTGQIKYLVSCILYLVTSKTPLQTLLPFMRLVIFDLCPFAIDIHIVQSLGNNVMRQANLVINLNPVTTT